MAERLREESLERLRRMTPRERLAEALELGEIAVDTYAAAHRIDRVASRRRLETAGQVGRRLSRAHARNHRMSMRGDGAPRVAVMFHVAGAGFAGRPVGIRQALTRLSLISKNREPHGEHESRSGRRLDAARRVT